ncbi:Phosphatidylglycerol--prolipoprotein diacylglyceryl transferase [subsurface metagenome]
MINIDINPIAFLNVRWYGILIALGIAVIILWVAWQVRKGAKISYDTVFTAALVGIPSGVVVSRLLHIIDNIVVAKLHPELALTGHVIDYTQHLELIIGGAGLSIYGAVLGAALGVWIYSKFSKLQFGYIADLIMPGLLLAQAIGRAGCTINGCCYGIEAPTWLPWAVVYIHPYSLAPRGIALHPTQPYEIIYLLIIFGVVLWLSGRLKPDGSLFLVYLSLYSLWRIGIDFIRDGTPFLFGLHQAQVISIIVLAITIPLLVLRTWWVSNEEENESEKEAQ